MLKKIVFICIALSGWTFANAQLLAEAEKLFQTNNFSAAKKQYEQVLATANGNDKFQAQLRLAACQYHLGEFLNAANTLYRDALPADPIWKARFLLYRVYLAQNTARRYRQILNKNEIDTPQAKADMATWTQAQWDEQIDNDFRQLWALQTDLIQAPIEAENLILHLKDTDTRRLPTLFDFTVHAWLHFLTQSRTRFSPAPLTDAAPSFLARHARLKKGRGEESMRLQAEILKAAYSLGGLNRQNAQVFWKTDFILLPFEQENYFIFTNQQEAVDQAVIQLNELSGFTASKELPSWWQRLKNYVRSTPQPDSSYARSYTAWKTAELLTQHEKAPQALAICAFAQTLAPSYFTQQCQNLTNQIHHISLSVSLPEQALNREAPQLNFSGKNLRTLYVRLYATSFEELTKIYKKQKYHSNLHSWEEIFSAPETEDFLALLQKTPLHTLTQPVVYEEPAKNQEGTLSLPSLQPGIYVAFVSADNRFDTHKAPVQAVVLNATDLALFATSGIEGDPADFTALRNTEPHTLTAPVFQLYAVHLKTGQPVARVPVELLTDWQGTREKVQLQADATASLKRTIPVAFASSAHHSIAALANHQGSVAYTPNLSFSFTQKQPVLFTLQTDRAIYRPGHKVQIALQAFERQVRGWKTLAAQNIQLTLKDPNWKTIFTTTLSTSKLGSAQTSFTLPQEGLLGNYHLEANWQTKNRPYTASKNFKVEEFKHPDYEITLNAPEKALEFGKPGKITGKAAYYMGTPLSGATVSYTLKRTAYIPPFYWWWDRWTMAQEQTLLQGQTSTDSQGLFTISFTPAPEQEEDEFAQFVLEAQVYDESGRPIETTRSYPVSKHPHLFKVDFAQGFYDANTESVLADIDLTDADGKSATGQIHLKAQLLENKLPPSPSTGCNYYDCHAQKQPLETLYKNFAVQKTAFEKTLFFNSPGKQTVTLPALPEGVYRLEVTSAKAAPQQLIFIVVQPNSQLQLPDVTLPQHNTYYPGETLRVLLGSAALAGSKRLEIYQDNQFLIHKEKLPGGIQIVQFPVSQSLRGGLALRWFGASHYQFHSGETSVQVPFDNKQLTINLQVPAVQKPGAQANWNLTAKNAIGAAVNGQVNVTVYDKSLDYYQKYVSPLTFTQLFPQQNRLPADVRSTHPAYPHFLGGPELPPNDSTPLALPSLNLAMQLRGYLRNAKGLQMADFAINSRAASAPQVMMAKGEMALGNAAEESTRAFSFTDEGEEENSAASASQTAQPDPSSLRTDFAETAYFNASLPLTNGQARLKFTLPQNLTTWNILGFVLTRTADFGAFSAQTITQKDFMLRLTLPRFYREADQSALLAAVTNQTNKKLTTQVTLSITRNQQSAQAAWGVKIPTQTITLAPHSTQFVSWPITVPYAPDLYQITAVARSGKDSDGEQKELPVLPAKQRLLASTHAALQNGANQLALTELADIPVEEVEITSFTLNPSLALSVLNSMPNLLSDPHQDLVSSLNRYVPLAVVHQFYTTYPQLKQAVKKLPKRTGLTASWNEKNPLLLELHANTPWLRQAQGRQLHQADIIDLFDDKTVDTRLRTELNNLAKFQNASGAFTWFAGGPDDEYLTLYALEAFSQALAYQANIPQAQAQKAFRFIVPKIETRLKQAKNGSVDAVAYALYAAYTLSAFPQTWPQYAQAKPYLKRWADYADQYAKFMTPLGQTYAAAVYHRLGDDVKAARYLDLVLSRVKEDPLTGAYFAPEAQSWLWYNDTLTSQTVTLRTLLEIRPQAPQLDSMVKWLLFNRQVNDWANSKAAAQAVFTLLDVMKAKGALATASTYQFRWGNEQQNISFEPMDWTEDLKFVHTGTQISAADYQVTVHKQGKMTDFASLNAIYRAREVTASPKGVLNLSRQYFRRVKEGTQTKLVPVENLAAVQVGDEIEVHLTLTTDSAFEYVQVKDPKPAGFESEELLSGWNGNPVRFYQEVRDDSTNFFIHWLPNGTVTFRYVLRPTAAGQFHAAAAQAQSMYAPEYGAHTASAAVKVTK